MSNSRRDLGREGEKRTAAFLEHRGFRILARNVRAGGVELDLVVRRGTLVVIVEVKARRSGDHGMPEEAVDTRKQARLIRGGAAWLREARLRGVRRVRFDVVACLRTRDGTWQLRHWEGAFDASR
ncbi:MAG: YraN family protein [Myxococcales bacterium]|nr:YraN family protein [Myxococcales bacterium]